MPVELEHYLAATRLRGPAADGAHSGAAGGAPCGDLVRVSFFVREGLLTDVSFDSEGCAAAQAAAAATAELIEGIGFLDAARIGSDDIAAELGGLSPQGTHASHLAADALHRALGAAAKAGIGGSPDRSPPPREGLSPIPAPSPARTLVAMSGGVDSAVAALLVRERGDEAVGITLELWTDPLNDAEKSCCSAAAVRDARDLAHSLGMPHLTVDLREEFRAGVVEPFLAGYAAGETPNPCVRCNGQVRIDAMAGIAGALGAEKLATGHYAQIERNGHGPLLTAPTDPAKDQTYMLAALSPEVLGRLDFPLSGLTKPEVRELARRAGLEVAERRESQDLCFLAGEGKRAFLRRLGGLEERDGEIVDTAGRVLGGHRGHQEFTVGQRRGLGIGAGEPLYVLGTEAAANRVVVGTRTELSTSRVSVRDARLRLDAEEIDAVRLRYHARPLRCRIAGAPTAGEHPRLTIELEDPAEGGAAPGQTAVFLAGERVVGHATISD